MSQSPTTSKVSSVCAWEASRLPYWPRRDVIMKINNLIGYQHQEAAHAQRAPAAPTLKGRADETKPLRRLGEVPFVLPD